MTLTLQDSKQVGDSPRTTFRPDFNHAARQFIDSNFVTRTTPKVIQQVPAERDLPFLTDDEFAHSFVLDSFV